MNRKKRLILLVSISVIVLISLFHSWLKRSYLDQIVLKQKVTVDIYRNTLEAALARFDYLPYVLSQNNKLFEQAFNQPDLANITLKSFKDSSKVDVIYIMNKDGETIASSNWNQKNTFVGKNYGYRPYFKQALKQQKGQFFGVGATTNIPGYFVSAPYRDLDQKEYSQLNENQVTAVIVVKVLLSSIVDSWSTRTQGDEIIFVADENQIIILSSKEDWLYQSLKQLEPKQLQAIKEQKQFGDNPNPLLYIKELESNKDQVNILDSPYIRSVASSNVMNWKIHYLIPYQKVNSRLITFWSRVLTLLLIGLAIVLIIRGINNRRALRLSQGESSLLRKLNLTLETEIEERKQIENKLRQAQVELRRTSKLTAMGQLSASITHEIGQPLAAMSTYIANMRISQQKLNDGNQVTSNSISTLSKLDQLVNRMTSITKQLRYFARSGDRETQALDFRQAINGAINTTLPSLEDAGITFKVERGNDPVMVEAGRVRLEQVIVNLLKNAMEAVIESSLNNESSANKEPSTNNESSTSIKLLAEHNPSVTKKWISLSLTTSENKAILKIDDTGPGVSEEIQKELFEPFFTTKASGVGMGLGLAISLNIIHELTGTLHVENRPEGGARFIITLPLINSNDNDN